jgi:hypothetical protein
MAVWSIIKVSELEGPKRLDPEYYQPTYLQINRLIHASSSFQWKTLDEISTKPITKGETPLWRGDIYQDSGVLFLRSENLMPCTVETSDSVFISDRVDERMKRSRVESGDVLIAIVGVTTGAVGLVPDSIGAANINQAIAIIRNPHLNMFLSIYLLTDIAQRQIERLSGGGAARDNLDLHEVKKLKCPIPTPDFINKINEQVQKIQSTYAGSESFYLQAEQMLLQEIGWDKLDLSQPKCWTVPLSRAQQVDRLDAEHFQPKYDKLIAHLKKTGRAKQLGELAHFIRRGLQPEYVEAGEVLVFTEKHLGRYLLDVDSAERTSLSFWEANPNAQIHSADIIMYSIGAYIGRTNIYLHTGKAVTSSNVTIIRTDLSKVVPEYLAVYLNSNLGFLQAQKWTASVGQMALYPADIPKFWVYLSGEKFQHEVAKLVRKSYQARQKAKALLEKAKRAVEIAIEQGQENAMAFLNA